MQILTHYSSIDIPETHEFNNIPSVNDYCCHPIGGSVGDRTQHVYNTISNGCEKGCLSQFKATGIASNKHLHRSIFAFSNCVLFFFVANRDLWSMS